jgi:hypothetical protein
MGYNTDIRYAPPVYLTRRFRVGPGWQVLGHGCSQHGNQRNFKLNEERTQSRCWFVRTGQGKIVVLLAPSRHPMRRSRHGLANALDLEPEAGAPWAVQPGTPSHPPTPGRPTRSHAQAPTPTQSHWRCHGLTGSQSLRQTTSKAERRSA